MQESFQCQLSVSAIAYWFVASGLDLSAGETVSKKQSLTSDLAGNGPSRSSKSYGRRVCGPRKRLAVVIPGSV